jgi:protein TonB
MFEHTAGDGTFIPSCGRFRSAAITVVLHGVVLAAIVVIPLMSMTDQLPKPPLMMAFVASVPPPPPPPPPPAPAAPTERAAKRIEELSTDTTFAAPVEIPEEIAPETGLVRGGVAGMPGGVEGGVPGGIVGGVLGGLPSEVPPPPPPPAPIVADPVRVGGAITQPALEYKVPPEYPEVALVAQLQGTVILEATVDTQGRVEAVRVLRSVGLLDDAAVAAVRQWRYRPLTLNGLPTPFILTVTVAFELEG